MINDNLRIKYPMNLQLFAEDPALEDKPVKIEFTPEQQAEVDRVVTERLARQQRKHDDEKVASQAEAERLQREQNEEYKTLYETAQAELDRVRNEAKVVESNALKTRLLIAAGYAADQLDRVSKYINGDDEVSINASIDEVKADMPPKATTVDPNPNNGGRQDPIPGDPGEAGKALFARLKTEGKLRS